MGSTKKSEKVKIKFQFIFSSTCEALVHSIWTSDKKVMNNLVLGAI